MSGYLPRLLPPPSPAKCDFCSSPKPAWFFPCRDFAHAGRDFTSGWLACKACHRDLVEERRAALVRRALLRYKPIVRSLVEGETERLFAAFDRNRTGDPLPV